MATQRQKLHYMWLVIKNAERMINDTDVMEASAMIKRAQNVRYKLNMSMSQITDTAKVGQIAHALATTLNADVVVEQDEPTAHWEPWG